MPTPKLFVRQYKDANGNVYLFHRYIDDHNHNYEYQVYQLVVAKKVTRRLGAPDYNANNTELNSRNMCDWVWDNVKQLE